MSHYAHSQCVRIYVSSFIAPWSPYVCVSVVFYRTALFLPRFTSGLTFPSSRQGALRWSPWRRCCGSRCRLWARPAVHRGRRRCSAPSADSAPTARSAVRRPRRRPRRPRECPTTGSVLVCPRRSGRMSGGERCMGWRYDGGSEHPVVLIFIII